MEKADHNLEMPRLNFLVIILSESRSLNKLKTQKGLSSFLGHLVVFIMIEIL